MEGYSISMEEEDIVWMELACAVTDRILYPGEMCNKVMLG